MSNPTPGPWTLGRILLPKTPWSVWSANTKICTMDANCADADARLIAAAPDMYEALKLARAQLVAIGGVPRPDERDFDNQGAVLDAVDAALSQATAKQER